MINVGIGVPNQVGSVRGSESGLCCVRPARSVDPCAAVGGAIRLGIEDLGTVQGSVIYRIERSFGLKEIVQVYN